MLWPYGVTWLFPEIGTPKSSKIGSFFNPSVVTWDPKMWPVEHLRMDPPSVCKQLCVNQFSTAPNAQSSDSAAADLGSPEMVS